MTVIIDRSGQLPGQPVKADGTNVVEPIQAILRGIDALVDVDENGVPKSTGGFAKDPDTSAALIESTASSLTKVSSTAIAAVGGVSVIVARMANFWGGSADSVRVMTLGGLASSSLRP